MRKLLLFIAPVIALCGNDFMSEYEYGAMLYENPRGISCAKCHGKKGKGITIGTYYTTDKKTKKRVSHEVKGADISKSTLEQMIASVGSVHDIMPTYSLTNDEVKAIYKYIETKNK